LLALEEVMEYFAELMQRLLEIQSGGRPRSPELIAEDARLMEDLQKRNLAGKMARPRFPILYGLVFDGDPLGQGGMSWARQRVEKVLCPSPFQLYTNPNGRLNCFGKEVIPPHDVMSPNFESY
jgi:hypothetical protein